MPGYVKNVGVIKCISCGRFIGHAEAVRGARCYYIPDTEYSAETVEWECYRCLNRQEKRKS